MSLTIFLALCILALDFMIYVLFKWLYGDRRSLIARRVAQQRKAAQAEAAGLIIFPARKSALLGTEPPESSGSRMPTAPREILSHAALFTLPSRHQLPVTGPPQFTLQITRSLEKMWPNRSCPPPSQPSPRAFPARF